MKRLAFVLALLILAVGAVGIFVPAGSLWIAQHSVTSGAFYVIGAVRVAFGLVLISAAPVSRAPKTLRILGSIILIAGITTVLTGLVAIERARAIVEWWQQQGSGVVRLTGVLVVALGGFIAYACASARPAA
jgi:hypothetical protein